MITMFLLVFAFLASLGVFVWVAVCKLTKDNTDFLSPVLFGLFLITATMAAVVLYHQAHLPDGAEEHFLDRVLGR